MRAPARCRVRLPGLRRRAHRRSGPRGEHEPYPARRPRRARGGREMTDELEQPPAPPAAEPAKEQPVVEGVEARVARLEERMDDVEAAAGAALMMHLEDDEDAEPERT